MAKSPAPVHLDCHQWHKCRFEEADKLVLLLNSRYLAVLFVGGTASPGLSFRKSFPDAISSMRRVFHQPVQSARLFLQRLIHPSSDVGVSLKPRKLQLSQGVQ